MSETVLNRASRRALAANKQPSTAQPRVTPRIMRLPEASAYSGISRTGLYRFRESGQLTFVKLGAKSVGIVTASLDALIDSLPVSK